MKRSFEHGKGGKKGERPMKSGRTVDVSLPHVMKFLTPKVLASAVIGTGGTAITAMRQKAGAKIALTEHHEFFPGTDCRVMTVQANSPDDTAEICREMASKVAEAAQTGDVDAVGDPGQLKVRALVPKAAVGGVIGKGGSVIKALRDSSGTKISFTEPVGNGPAAEQVCTVTGDQAGIEMVLLEVNRQVQALSHEDWFSFWASDTGAVSGKGEAPRKGGKGGGGGGGSDDGYHGPPPRKGGKGKGDDGYHQPPPRDHGHHGGAPRGRGGPPGVDTMVHVANTLPEYVMEDSRGFALSCVVPNSFVGGMIGRGGAGTKEVQSMTGTKIGIREIEGDPENRSLNIAGPLASTCAAYMLMMKRYLDSEAHSSAPPGGRR